MTPEARRKLIESPISINYISNSYGSGGNRTHTRGFVLTAVHRAKPVFRDGYTVRPHQHRFQNDSGAITVGRAAFSED